MKEPSPTQRGAAAEELAVETRGLVKRFGQRAAVDGIDLAVPRGAVFGFLGPNGSGKTTTIRVLLGLASATSGDVRVLDQSMPAALASVLPNVGALVEGPGFYPFLTGPGNLMRLDSADRHALPATRRQRVAEALDVRSLAAGGTTVFVSSHLLAEVEQMCTHVGVMSAGRLVAQGPLAELRSAGQRQVVVETPDAERANGVLARLGLVPAATPDGERPIEARAVMNGGLAGPAPEEIVAALVADGVRVRGFAVEDASLEDRFVSLTGEGFDVVG
ncbi:ATP-binding cassette domain-containing protein [Paenarthrobacter sp. RAF9]